MIEAQLWLNKRTDVLFDFLLPLPQDLRYAELMKWADGASSSINSRFYRVEKNSAFETSSNELLCVFQCVLRYNHVY